MFEGWGAGGGHRGDTQALSRRAPSSPFPGSAYMDFLPRISTILFDLSDLSVGPPSFPILPSLAPALQPYFDHIAGRVSLSKSSESPPLKGNTGASLVAQWCLRHGGMQVPTLVGELRSHGPHMSRTLNVGHKTR